LQHEHCITLDFQLKGSDFESAGEASSRLKAVLQQIGVKADIVRRIAVSTYEAELNVIIHAYHGTLSAAVYPDRTEINVADTGPGIADIDLAMQEGYSTAPEYVRKMGFGAGMGLPNMVRCTDKFTIESQVGKGTVINMTILY
jgi:serine/threonine-protein kinase RsbT